MRYRIPFYLIVATSFLVGLASYRFAGLGVDLSFPGFDDHLSERRAAFLTHVTLASVALIFGVFQFMPRLRARHPAVHRWTGRIYAACVLVSGVAGFLLALHAPGGWIAGAGFAVLAILWLFSTGTAVIHAVRRQIAMHREWMIRSFALTFAGVTLRIYLGAVILSGGGYAEASVWLAWVCWVPNLIVAEWWIGRDRKAAAFP